MLISHQPVTKALLLKSVLQLFVEALSAGSSGAVDSCAFLDELETCKVKECLYVFLSGFHIFVGPLACRQHGQGSADNLD